VDRTKHIYIYIYVYAYTFFCFAKLLDVCWPIAALPAFTGHAPRLNVRPLISAPFKFHLFFFMCQDLAFLPPNELVIIPSYVSSKGKLYIID